MKATKVEEMTKRKRQHPGKCKLCCQNHIKCDSFQPIWISCQSCSITKCVFDTEANGESRNASLKSDNQALRNRVLAIKRSLSMCMHRSNVELSSVCSVLLTCMYHATHVTQMHSYHTACSGCMNGQYFSASPAIRVWCCVQASPVSDPSY